MFISINVSAEQRRIVGAITNRVAQSDPERLHDAIGQLLLAIRLEYDDTERLVRVMNRHAEQSRRERLKRFNSQR
jgi:predicted ATPase